MNKAPIFEFSVQTITGETTTLEPFAGKLLLIVNVASECGFTVKYTGLEELFQKYKDRGLVVLGFPCDQFGGQEPGSNEEILNFCTTKFSVSFPLFAKIEVNGAGEHPLFAYLKREEPGILGTQAIKWNFTKFLVGRDGKVLKRFAPQATPESIGLEIEKLL